MRLRTSSVVVAAFALFAVLLMASRGWAQVTPVYKNSKAPLEARVNDLLSRMTQDEKLGFMTGTGFTTQPLPRLGLPAMGMADAGEGVRGGAGSTQGPATQFPAGAIMASSWNPVLVGQIGKAIGEEALNKGTGVQVLLGPAVNIQRSPLGGRNSEYFSEDPFLAGRLAVGYIQGMQSTGCAACIKHFACNNEEVDRMSVNVNVSERALREIYLPAFESGVQEGHAWSVMASYNRVGGYYATANQYLLTDVLRKDWGWDGLVMSDWGAVHETAGVVSAGNDLEMPGGAYLTHDKVARALKSGRITQAEIDDSVRRILRTVIRVGLLDGPRTPDHSVVNSPQHQRLAYEAACSGMVLLKNAGGILPLDAAKIKSIAVIGPAAMAMQLGSAGSPSVTPFYTIQPLDGIKTRVGSAVTVNYAAGQESGVTVPASALASVGARSGLRGEYFANRNLDGQPSLVRSDSQLQFDWSKIAPALSVPRTNFSVRWTGMLTAPTTGRYMLSLTGDDGYRLFLDGKQLIDHWFEGGTSTQTVEVPLAAGHAYPLRIEYFQAGGDASLRFSWMLPGASSFADATEAAQKSDVAVVFVTTSGTEGEGGDRPSLALPGSQDRLIQAVAAANPKTIVVLNNGTPVLMPWLRQVPGLVEAWFPGQEGGHAIASLLFGDINPSGKLPTTLAARREDYPDYGHFPGTDGQVTYAEGIYVGYRHFDKQKIAPLFPFGYGLSYTTFRYSHLRLSGPQMGPNGTVTASVDVTNTGQREGAEVAELYVHDPAPRIDKPVRELKGFGKVDLLPGQTKTVTMTLRPRDLAYCDVPGKQWKADAGRYEIEVGASSRDIRQQAVLRLAATYTEPIPLLGDEPAPPVRNVNDLAYKRPVTASSVQEADTPASNVTDGDDSTRWSSSFSDPQWVAIDLGKSVTIDHVKLLWEDAYASAYSIQVSQDGKNYADVYTTQNGTGDPETIKFAPVAARFVRVYATKRATQFGVSLFSVEVYAPGT